MSVGSMSDMLSRIKSVLPIGWFPVTGQNDTESATPVLDAALSGPAWSLSWFFTFLSYVVQQTRIKTATGMNLDLVAADFFGSAIVRGSGETDARFLVRILAALFPNHGTRQAVLDAATAAAGGRCAIFEPNYALDAGGWDVGTTGYDTPGSCGWGTALMPFQSFLTCPTGEQANVYAAVEMARPVATIIWTEA